MTRVVIPQVSATPRVPSAAVQYLHGETMGTTWSVKLIAPVHLRLEDLRAGVQRELDRVVSQMSNWEPTSDLSLFNDAPAGSWHVLRDEFFAVLRCALDVARETNGAFDPTVGRMVARWGFGAERHRAAWCDDADWTSVLLDATRLAACQPGGVALDLCAIAKGFGVDQVARYLSSHEVDSYLVEVGGELRGRGIKPDGAPWWVRLELPPDMHFERSVVALHELSVATSGDYRRFFHDGDVRYSHTMDPRSGKPIANGVASVSVLHESCMVADAWSTALTVLGVDEGLALASRLDLAALFVCRTSQGAKEQLTPALQAMLA